MSEVSETACLYQVLLVSGVLDLNEMIQLKFRSGDRHEIENSIRLTYS
jgi:hypothetical protein